MIFELLNNIGALIARLLFGIIQAAVLIMIALITQILNQGHSRAALSSQGRSTA